MSTKDREKEGKEPTVDLNVVLLPDEVTTDKLIALSTLLGKHFPTAFTLDREFHLPHLSLYPARYPLRNQDKVEETVRNIAGSLEGMDVILEGYSEFSGFLFFNVVKDRAIQNLHDTVFAALNEQREGHVSDVVARLRGLSPRLKANVRRWGQIFVGEDYTPHVTLGYLQDRKLAREAIEILPQEPIQFSPSAIALAPFAPYGTCPKPLFTFPVGR
ncbi:MAG: 2'-5' RNA ligase family protein [Candidatus Levybacteria bacterium]|nr:2'-5' RNA ligase family protein [Candidatus Levybacteria bacterium]